MSGRVGVGAVVVGAALAIIGLSTPGAGGLGAAPQDFSPRRGPLEESSPRSQAARQLATLLRDGVEVDVPKLIAELPEPKALADRRAEIADQMMEFALVKFVEPPSPSGERGTFHAAIVDYMDWSSRRLDTTLELADSDDSRRDAMAREVAKLRRVGEVYRQLADAEGIITPQNQLELEFKRLELESRLAALVGDAGGR